MQEINTLKLDFYDYDLTALLQKVVLEYPIP
jgi:hypothetical protein